MNYEPPPISHADERCSKTTRAVIIARGDGKPDLLEVTSGPTSRTHGRGTHQGVGVAPEVQVPDVRILGGDLGSPESRRGIPRAQSVSGSCDTRPQHGSTPDCSAWGEGPPTSGWWAVIALGVVIAAVGAAWIGGW